MGATRVSNTGATLQESSTARPPSLEIREHYLFKPFMRHFEGFVDRELDGRRSTTDPISDDDSSWARQADAFIYTSRESLSIKAAVLELTVSRLEYFRGIRPFGPYAITCAHCGFIREIQTSRGEGREDILKIARARRPAIWKPDWKTREQQYKEASFMYIPRKDTNECSKKSLRVGTLVSFNPKGSVRGTLTRSSNVRAVRSLGYGKRVCGQGNAESQLRNH